MRQKSSEQIIDFIALRDRLQEIVLQLDHRMLLPLNHAAIRVQAGEKEVEVRFEERRWVFPSEDCLLLPIQNTTAEELAAWIAEELKRSAFDGVKHQLTTLQIEVEENFGQWAIAQIRL